MRQHILGSFTICTLYYHVGSGGMCVGDMTNMYEYFVRTAKGKINFWSFRLTLKRSNNISLKNKV